MSRAGCTAAVVLGVGLVGAALWFLRPAPATTPRGAFQRVALHTDQGRPEALFSYLDETAQQEAFTIRDYSRQSLALVEDAFPVEERARWIEQLRPLAQCEDGKDAFAHLARQRGWLERLHKDLSAIRTIEESGERASVETVNGTRYPFRRRPNGMWGVTLFTAELQELALKAARDHETLERSAKEFQRAKPAP